MLQEHGGDHPEALSVLDLPLQDLSLVTGIFEEPMAASVGLAKFDIKTGQVVYIGGAWGYSLDQKVTLLRHIRWLNKGAQPPGTVFIPWESDEDPLSLYPKMIANQIGSEVPR